MRVGLARNRRAFFFSWGQHRDNILFFHLFAFIPTLERMERLGKLLANWMYEQKRQFRLLSLKHSYLTPNRLSILLIVLFGVIPLSLYFLFSRVSFSWARIIASYLFVILLFALAMLIVIAWYKSEEMLKNNVQGFSFVTLSSSKVDAVYFGFNFRDIDNLLKLVRGLPSENKIIIRETPKSKQSGNIRFLFTFLDLITRGGIFRMGSEPKEALTVLIAERFAFENSDINLNTIASSYSKWCKATEEGSYDDLKKQMSTALGIS